MSDTVKLIIEIPKPMYESVQNGTYCGTLYEELKNGIPLDENKGEWLDKIRAEILVLDDADYDYEGYYKAVTDALHIIDKYKAESEDK